MVLPLPSVTVQVTLFAPKTNCVVGVTGFPANVATVEKTLQLSPVVGVPKFTPVA